jgi:hypothetical protein
MAVILRAAASANGPAIRGPETMKKRWVRRRCPMSPADDEGEHVKEVFAYFGRAYHYASVLETGLAIALLFAEFLPRV